MTPAASIALVRDYTYSMGAPCLFVFHADRAVSDRELDLALGRLDDTTTMIHFPPTRGGWQRAYGIARELAALGAASCQPRPGEDITVHIDLGRHHTLTLVYRCTRPRPAGGAR